MTEVGGVHQRLIVTALLVVAALASGCEWDAPGDGEPGEGSGASADEGEAPGSIADDWELASTPSLEVGTDPSDPDAVLEVVREAVRLSDGRIVVANGGLSSRLPVFSPEGRYNSSIGRRGEGPGEFGWITSLQVGPNDSLFVFDAGLQRLTVFLEDGQLARVASFIPAGDVRGSGLLSATRMADGRTWVGRGRPRNLRGEPGVILRDTISIGLLDDTFSEFRVLADLPGRMTTTTVVGGLSGFGAPAFSPRVVHAVWGRCVFVSTGDDPWVSVFGADGRLVSTLEGPGAPRPVIGEHVESREEALLRYAPEDERPIIRDRFRAAAKTTHLPYYHAIIADEWGHVWLQEYSPPWGMGRRWYVLSQSGDRMGEVEMPRTLTVYSITRDGVLGSSHGEFDQETVELFSWASHPSEMADPLPECVVS